MVTTQDGSEPAALAATRWGGGRLDELRETVGTAGTPLADREQLAVTYPATDEPIGTIPLLSDTDVQSATERCREASQEWRETSPAERVAVLDRFAELVESEQPDLLDLIQLETAKARTHALEELIDVPLTAEYYARTAQRVLETERRAPAIPLVSTAEVAYDPVGVVGVITPWNYPFTLAMTDVLPALAAGNGVVLKPDEKTPFVALRLVELLEAAGLPEDVCTVVTGEGDEVGPALIDEVDYLTFTGSSETGRLVGEQAGRNLIDCSLELGGKNPMLVVSDADVDEAARGAVLGCFTNAGQLCLSIERIYVEEPLFESFLDAFVAQTEALTLGGDLGYEGEIGSLIDQAQLERVQSHVEDAREQGATVETGGQARPDVGPYFYEPTILTDLPSSSLPACEETFGPVVSVEPVASVEEGIEAANDTEYGLNASIYTGDRERGVELAHEIRSGTVCVNDSYASGYAALDAPMGGVGDSGVGRRHGPEGLKRYTEPKTIASSRLGPVGPPPLVPDSIYGRVLLSSSRLLRRAKKILR